MQIWHLSVFIFFHKPDYTERACVEAALRREINNPPGKKQNVQSERVRNRVENMGYKVYLIWAWSNNSFSKHEIIWSVNIKPWFRSSTVAQCLLTNSFRAKSTFFTGHLKGRSPVGIIEAIWIITLGSLI